ncbi:MAG: hypothetical protein ACK5BE_02650 [Alphaproteobacteria bacterium]|jgi:hypothetical protein
MFNKAINRYPLFFKKIVALLLLFFVVPVAYAKPRPEVVEDLPYTVPARSDRFCFRNNFNSGRKYSDLVFTGRFIEQQELGASILIFGRERQNVAFEVVEPFKGNVKKEEKIYIQIEDIYDYNFEPNEIYLVFAYNHYKDKYTLLACPRIEPAFKYNDRLAYLRVPDDEERNKLFRKQLLAEKKGEIFISKLDGPIYAKGGIIEINTVNRDNILKPLDNNIQPETNSPPATAPKAEEPKQQKLPDFITDEFVPLESLDGQLGGSGEPAKPANPQIPSPANNNPNPPTKPENTPQNTPPVNPPVPNIPAPANNPTTNTGFGNEFNPDDIEKSLQPNNQPNAKPSNPQIPTQPPKTPPTTNPNNNIPAPPDFEILDLPPLPDSVNQNKSGAKPVNNGIPKPLDFDALPNDLK